MFLPGGYELLILFVVALIVFGPKRLPEIGRQVGKGMRAFREAAREIESHLNLDDFDSPPYRKQPRRVETPSIAASSEPSEGSSEEGSEYNSQDDLEYSSEDSSEHDLEDTSGYSSQEGSEYNSQDDLEYSSEDSSEYGPEDTREYSSEDEEDTDDPSSEEPRD